MRGAVFFELPFETTGAVPVGVLPPVVGEHLLGWIVLAFGSTVDLDEVVRRLAAKEIHARDVAGEVIDEADEVSVITAQPEGEDVRLPKLVGLFAFKESRPARVVRSFPMGRGVQVLRDQCPADRLRAAG